MKGGLSGNMGDRELAYACMRSEEEEDREAAARRKTGWGNELDPTSYRDRCDMQQEHKSVCRGSTSVGIEKER